MLKQSFVVAKKALFAHSIISTIKNILLIQEIPRDRTKCIKIVANYYESRVNKYYLSHIALHKIIRKKRFVNKIKIIKIT